MTYPDTAGFQSHSETSRDAAAKLDASTLRGKILERLGDYRTGLTIDDISIIFDIVPGTASARLRELEMAGNVVKTKEKRLTRYKRKAFVYVHVHNYHPNMGRATVKKAPDCDIVKMEAEHARMKATLEALDGAIMTGSRVALKCAIWKGLGKGEYKDENPYT